MVYPWIYHVYPMYIGQDGIYTGYTVTLHLPGIYRKSGFQMNYFLHCYSCAEGLGCVQDTIVVIPPYPYSITEDIDDVPFKDCWYAP